MKPWVVHTKIPSTQHKPQSALEKNPAHTRKSTCHFVCTLWLTRQSPFARNELCFDWLKGFFHGSAHARVLRNLICVPARNKANFWGFTRRIVEGGFYLKKSLSVLHIGDQKSFCLDHILLRRWVLVLFYCSFVKVVNFEMWLIKSRATLWLNIIRKGSQISFKSYHWQKE